MPIYGDPLQGQTIRQPDNTTLAVNSLNQVLWADQFLPGNPDLGAKVLAAYAALPLPGGRIRIARGRYDQFTPIVFGGETVMENGQPAWRPKAVFVECDGHGTEITFKGAGTAWTWDNGNLMSANGMFGCQILGQPNNDGTPNELTKGIYIGGANGAAGFVMTDASVSLFGTLIEIGNLAWNLSFNHLFLYNARTWVNLPAGLNTSGENIVFSQTTFASDWRHGKDGVLLQLASGFTRLTDCNFDNVSLVLNGGELRATNIYFEPPNMKITAPYYTQETGVASLTGWSVFNGRDVDENASPKVEALMDIKGGSIALQAGNLMTTNSSTPVPYGVRVNSDANVFTSADINHSGSWGVGPFRRVGGAGNGVMNAMGTMTGYQIIHDHAEIRFDSQHATSPHGISIGTSDTWVYPERSFKFAQMAYAPKPTPTNPSPSALLFFSKDATGGSDRWFNYWRANIDGTFDIMAPLRVTASFHVTAPTPDSGSGLGLGTTTAIRAREGTAKETYGHTVPSRPEGYLVIRLDGREYRIPYFLPL